MSKSAFGPAAGKRDEGHVCSLDDLPLRPSKATLGQTVVCGEDGCMRVWRVAEITVSRPQGLRETIMGWEIAP